MINASIPTYIILALHAHPEKGLRSSTSIAILAALVELNGSGTTADVANKLNICADTVLRQCRSLHKAGFLKVSKKKRAEGSGRDANVYSI